MENTNRDQVSKVMTSAEKIAGNEDLLSEILVRLPVRSLVRFKRVSKPWLVLISSSHFSLNHTRRNLGSLPVSGFVLNNLDFVGLDGSRPEFWRSLSFMEKRGVRMNHCCNGLMLCSTSRDDYFVCNPTTKKFSAIPPPPPPRRVAGLSSLCEFGSTLVFDPSRSSHFKVVYFTGMCKFHNKVSQVPFICSAHLYSSDTQSWSSLESPDREFLHSVDHCYRVLHNGVLCNGSLYWLSAHQWKLLRFEVDEQRFSIITMNVDLNLIGTRNKDYSAHLWQCKGKLYLVKELDLVNVSEHMVVYEMGNVCSEWLVKYMVKFPDEVSGLVARDNSDSDEDEECSYSIIAAVGGQKDDEDDDMLLLIRLEYTIRDWTTVLYSIKEKTTTEMIFMVFEREAQPYIASLSPVI